MVKNIRKNIEKVIDLFIVIGFLKKFLELSAAFEGFLFPGCFGSDSSYILDPALGPVVLKIPCLLPIG